MIDARSLAARLAEERYADALCVLVGGSALSMPEHAFDIDVLVLRPTGRAGNKEVFRYGGALIDAGYFDVAGLREQLLRQHAAGICNIADYLARAELVQGDAALFRLVREQAVALFKPGPPTVHNRPAIAFQVATLLEAVLSARSGDEAFIGATQVLRLIEGHHQRLLGRWCNPGKFLVRETVALGESGWLPELLAGLREVGSAKGSARFHAAVHTWLRLHGLEVPVAMSL